MFAETFEYSDLNKKLHYAHSLIPMITFSNGVSSAVISFDIWQLHSDLVCIAVATDIMYEFCL